MGKLRAELVVVVQLHGNPSQLKAQSKRPRERHHSRGPSNHQAAATASSTPLRRGRKFSRSDPAVTFTVELSKISPMRIFSANGSCSSFWITRFSGLAP